MEIRNNKNLIFLAISILIVVFFVTASEIINKKAKFPEDTEIQQFVLLSFDGGKSIDTWEKTLDFADLMNKNGIPIHFTYFINSIYLLANENNSNYTRPGGEIGHSAIGFAEDLNSIEDRVHEINRAVLNGHEIASHTAGHWKGGSADENWDLEKWHQEFSSFNNLLFNIKDNNPELSSIAKPTELLTLKRSDIKGFRAPHLSTNDNMYKALALNGFTYDSSQVSYGNEMEWPHKDKYGIWHIQIPSDYFPNMNKSIIAVDYSIWVNQTHGQEILKKDTKEWQNALKDLTNGYMNHFEKSYFSNRAPMVIVNHFPLWNDGLYWEAMKKFAIEVCGKPHVRCSTFSDLVKYLEK